MFCVIARAGHGHTQLPNFLMNNETKSKPTTIQQTISGCTAGVISRLVIAPMDVLKIRFQMETSTTNRKYKSVFNSLRMITKEEGILALWKGNLVATYMYFVYGGVQFWSYFEIQSRLKQSTLVPKSFHDFIAGAGAGVLATTVCYPLDLLRTRFAVQGNEKLYKSFFGAITDIKKSEGIKGFYKGWLPSVLSIMPQMGLVFHFHGIYTSLYDKHLKHGGFLDASNHFISGGLAGITSKLLVLPLDLIRKRLQVQGPLNAKMVTGPVPKYEKLVGALASILKKEGVRGLFRGVWPTILKAGPASATTFFVVEQMRIFWTRQ